MASEDLAGQLPNLYIRQNSSNAVSLEFDPNVNYQFVEILDERYKCTRCHLVLHNPHQTGCGHRFCQYCIVSLRDLNTVSTCPIDNEIIKLQEVFKDNCCKREVLNLQVFCKNSPACAAKLCLGRYQTHEKVDCPNYPWICPYGCMQMILMKEAEDHVLVCPEMEIDCPYKMCGCPKRVKRSKLLEHEDIFLREHMLQIADKNTKLEDQISDLYNSLTYKERKILQLSDMIKNCEREFRQLSQLFCKNSNLLASTQTLAIHIDKNTFLETQLRQLVQKTNQQQSKLDLRTLLDTIDNLKQKVALLESYDQRLVVLEDLATQQDTVFRMHGTQLNKNEERFKILEGASYNGKLIWKIMDYKIKKKQAIEGHNLSLCSQPFYTSHCGYRLSARAYLNGDGSGRGTHVSMYFVVMRGEFDSLLSWPFKQKVTLMLLDQSGRKKHICETFKADPNSSSFKRPEGEMNVASGCPRFVAHSVLENAKNTYIRDDILFLKVMVDLTDLEEL
uniref:TNF receptor-associated factor n=1 Tax=Laticauda laticaudata TaxID=8630 RepID=A0A8C5SWU9_LATLA